MLLWRTLASTVLKESEEKIRCPLPASAALRSGGDNWRTLRRRRRLCRVLLLALERRAGRARSAGRARGPCRRRRSRKRAKGALFLPACPSGSALDEGVGLFSSDDINQHLRLNGLQRRLGHGRQVARRRRHVRPECQIRYLALARDEPEVVASFVVTRERSGRRKNTVAAGA